MTIPDSFENTNTPIGERRNPRAIGAGDEAASDRRQQTRAALTLAARNLVYQRGHERISIQDITHDAGVGTGTFYNYFETKQEVFAAALDDLREQFAASARPVRRQIKDPAMLIAVTLKYYLREAVESDAWNQFVDCAGLGEHLLCQPDVECLADIERGAKAGRFKVEDAQFTASLVQGMILHAIREMKAERLSRSAINETTRHILRMLGLPDLVAKALVQGPMPEITPPDLLPVTVPENDVVTPFKVIGEAS